MLDHPSSKTSTTSEQAPNAFPRKTSRLLPFNTVLLPLLASSSIRVDGTSSQSKPRLPKASPWFPDDYPVSVNRPTVCGLAFALGIG